MSTLIFDRRTGPVRVVVTAAGQLQMLEGDRVVELKPRQAQRLAGQLVGGGGLDCDVQTFEIAQALDEAVDAYRFEFGDPDEHIAPGTLTVQHRAMIAATVVGLLEAGVFEPDAIAATVLNREYKRGKGGRFASGRSGTAEQLHDDDKHIAATFNYSDPVTGMTATVTGVRRQGPHFTTYVDIKIHDRDGREIGQAERQIRPPGQLAVHHAEFYLSQGRGQGFATRWNDHAEESYRAHGIEKITLHANLDVGGYAWARAGYDFASDMSRHDIAQRAVGMAAQRTDFSPAVKAEIHRLAADPTATPLEWSQLGHEDGVKVWPGKRIMYASSWDGVKDLT